MFLSGFIGEIINVQRLFGVSKSSINAVTLACGGFFLYTQLYCVKIIYSPFNISKESGGQKRCIVVMIQELLSKEYEEWQRNYISLVCCFRNFVRLQNKSETPDAGQRKHFLDKSERVSNNIQESADRARSVFGLTFDQIKELTVNIRVKAAKGKVPEKIQEELNQERAEKNKTATL